MRTFEETPSILVVDETPWVARAILTLMLAMLAWNLYRSWSEMSWFVCGVAGMFLALLLLIFLMVAMDVTARFDRSAGRIDIARRGPFGARRETYNLQDFQRARVEVWNDSDEPTYRLILVFSAAMPAAMDPILRLRLERRRRLHLRRLPLNEVPFTDYLSSGGRTTKAAEAINAWAGAL
ncbi:MAG TPA: hypothetical protein VGG69_08470 [Rhizomicrobium sp.]|jgi:hypothetical protein